jgi:hypothetical protein
MVCLAQTVHPSCDEINIVFKQNETSFHLTDITYEYNWVRPKWFLSLWNVQRNPCTYLVLRLTLPPNGSKWASTWVTLPWSTIRCVQNYFWAYGTFYATVHLACAEINTISKWSKMSFTWPTSPWSTIRCIQNYFWAYETFGANRAPILRRD